MAVVVQFARIPLRADRQRLAGAGLEVGVSLGSCAYRATIHRKIDFAGLDPHVRWVGLGRADDRLSTALWDELEGAAGILEFEAIVQLEAGVTKEDAVRLLGHFQPEQQFSGAWKIRAAAERLRTLATDPRVAWIERSDPLVSDATR